MATIVYVRVSSITSGDETLELGLQGQALGDNIASTGGNVDVAPGTSASDIKTAIAQATVDSLAIDDITLDPETDSILLLHDIDLVSLTIPS